MSRLSSDAVILIVGGGCSGIAVAAAIRRKHSNATIVIAERRESIGLGVAYSTESEHHLLNVPAIKMGIYEESHDHFYLWTNERGLNYGAADFVPRQTYGRYLQDVLAREILAVGKTRVVRDDIISLERCPNGFRALTAGGESIDATSVVLATGHTPPQVPVGTIDGTLDKRFVLNPWSAEGYEDLTKVSQVGILGTGLTAIDVVGALDALKFQGAITLFSRRGMIPFPSVSGGRPMEFVIENEAFADSLRGLVRRVRKQLREYVEQGRDWHVIVDAFRPHTPAIWKHLSEFERGQFLRHLRSYWEVARHRMPERIYRRVRELEAEGRLTICRGRVEALDFKSDAQLVNLRSRHRGTTQTSQFERVFNCAGSGVLTAQNLPPILQSLKAHNAIQFDRFGLGMYTASSGELLDRDNGIVRGCFLIGPARRASEWESTAVREIRIQAQQIADSI